MKMLNQNRIVNKNNLFVFAVLAVTVIFCFFPLTSVYAAVSVGGVDMTKIMTTLQRNAPHITRFVVATAYVMGIWFIFSSISSLKRMGQSQTMMQQRTMTGPLIKLVVGIMMLYLPTAIDLSVTTIWGYSSSGMLEYPDFKASSFIEIKRGAVAIVRVVGYISFVRGFVILSRAGEQGGQQGTAGKGFMHIIGGILAINIVGTIDVIRNTLGFGG